MHTTESPSLPRQLMFVLVGTAAILLVLLAASRLTDAMAWSPFDFLAAGLLLAGTGTLYVLGTRLAKDARTRIIIGLLAAGLLALVWAELAVGVFGTPFAGS